MLNSPIQAFVQLDARLACLSDLSAAPDARYGARARENGIAPVMTVYRLTV